MTYTELQQLRQEHFNLAFLGLAAQGFQQARDVVGCLLLDARGRRCALGHILGIEGTSDYSASQLAFVALTRGPDRRFYASLRSVHDNENMSLLSMEERLRNFARRWGLQVPPTSTTES